MSSARRAYLTVVPPVDGVAWSDRDLVAALSARDPRASVQAWRKYAPRIFGIVERTLGLASDAEDITQDIFLRVFARSPRPREMAVAVQFLESQTDRKEAYGSLLWSLVATNEFLFNH